MSLALHSPAGGVVYNEFSGVISGVSGVAMVNGGEVENNGGIYGVRSGVAATGYGNVFNAGTIFGYGVFGVGVYLGAGGYVQNDYNSDIKGSLYGVQLTNVSGTVNNVGRVTSQKNAGDYGIAMSAGGGVYNHNVGGLKGAVVGFAGVVIKGAAGTVINTGLIYGYGGDGVRLSAGGVVTNGQSPGDGAVIYDYQRGVVIGGGTGTVANHGTIAGGNYGVYLTAGGSVTNGSSDDTAALMYGGNFGVLFGALDPGTMSNFGTIKGPGGYGVELEVGGVANNGSPTDATAVITGYGGLELGQGAQGINYGAIDATGLAGEGVRMFANATLENAAGGSITGHLGIFANGVSITVTNAGTISGTGGTAVSFTSSSDVLVVEAGSAFMGAVTGDGGELRLGSGVGTLSGLAGGNATVSGSMATTTFQNFNTFQIDAGATFVDTEAVTIAGGQTVISEGSLALGAKKAKVTNAGLIETAGAGALTIKGALVNTGTLAANGGILKVTGAVSGKGGVAVINGGTLDFGSSFKQAVTFTGGTGTLELGQSQAYTGMITGFSKAGGTLLDLTDIGFVSVNEATFSGTSKGGMLTVTDGTHTARINLKGNYLGSVFVAASDGHGGVLIHDPVAPAGQPLAFVAAMAAFRTPGGGAVSVAREDRETSAQLFAPRGSGG